MQSAFETFSLSIEQIGKNIRKYKDEQAAELGLRGIHVMVLHQLSKSDGGMTAAALSRACGVNRAFVSRVLAELLSLSLVQYADPSAERLYRMRLLLTDRGVETVERMNRRIDEAVSEIGGDISMRDMAIFYSVLRRLDARLSAMVDSGENAKNGKDAVNDNVKEDY